MALKAHQVWAALHNPGALTEVADVAVDIRRRLDDAGAVLVKARTDLAELAPDIATQAAVSLTAAGEVAVRVTTIGDRARRLAG